MWQLFLFLTLVLAVLYLILDAKRPNRFPPGPDWFPLVGNYFLFYRLRRELRFTHLVWERLTQQYGGLVGLKLGRDRIVVASGNKLAREILTRDEFDARPDGFFFRLRSFGQRYGLVFVDGAFFDEQRKFCLKHLKSFGLNRSIMENRITMEITDFTSALSDCCSKPIKLPEAVQVSVLNSLWSIVAGERFKIGDARSLELLSHINTAFRLQDMSGGILNQMPFLRFVAPGLSSYNKLNLLIISLTTFLRELINDHKKNDGHYENRDLIDAFLQEINRGTPGFTEEQLIILLLDLFLAGAETTTSTLAFALLYLLHFPSWQSKLQNELDEVVGRTGGASPQLHHRPQMKFMEVYLMELQRHANVTPTTISHRASQDAEVNGYVIPRDSVVLVSLYSLHMDKEHWGDPEVFRPERFLDSDGQIRESSHFLPFGTGKRRCIGEGLAKANLFLFLSAILQKFTVRPVPGQPIPSLKSLDGATLSPKHFECVFELRNGQF